MNSRQYCCHPDCTTNPATPIPHEDMPYVKMELIKGTLFFTCMEHMTLTETEQRFEESFKTFEEADLI